MAIRAPELMAVVSAAGDFAKGFAEEQALRTCRIGMRLADRAGLPVVDRQAVFYLSLLRFVGCTATASGMAMTSLYVKGVGSAPDPLTMAQCACAS